MLGAEMLAACVPLPGGTLLLPRLVSNRVHAPYFAEIAILHQLSILPEYPDSGAPERAPIPPVTCYILLIEGTALLVLLLICKRLIFRPKGKFIPTR